MMVLYSTHTTEQKSLKQFMFAVLSVCMEDIEAGSKTVSEMQTEAKFQHAITTNAHRNVGAKQMHR